MSTKTIITRQWIETAKWAASGGNFQPWQIQLVVGEKDEVDKIDEIKLKITINQKACTEQSPLDVKGSATVISLGCLTTNLKYIAQADSYTCQYELNEVTNNFYQTEVNLTFKKEYKYKPVMPFNVNLLLTRHTDRYPYKRKKIPEELIGEINQVSKDFLPLKTFSISKKHRFFKHYFKAECIRWKSNTYVDSLFSEINFDHDIKKYADKIPVGQLGLSRLDEMVFKALNKSKILRRTLQRFLPAFLAFKSLVNYKYFSDKIFIIQTNEFNVAQIFKLGLLFQELWLLAEKYKMGFQPLGSTLVFAKENSHVDSHEKIQILKASNKIKNEFAVDLNHLSLGFRIGHPSKKAARSPRKSFEEIFTIKNEKKNHNYLSEEA